MSEGAVQGPGQPVLSFDQAQFSQGPEVAAGCAFCEQPIAEAYFTVNGRVACSSCAARVQEDAPPGTRWSRGLTALGFGGLGGVAGWLLYWLVARLTGYEFGLIAIVVGVLVGKGVRKGSGDRGGRAYQVLAVGLTYAAIAGTTVPAIVEAIFTQRPPGATAQASPSATRPESGTGQPEAGTAAGEHADASAPLTTGPPPTILAMVAGLALLTAWVFALAMASPFLGGFQNIMGIVIIAIGLHQAWKANERVSLMVFGPYALAPANASVVDTTTPHGPDQAV